MPFVRIETNSSIDATASAALITEVTDLVAKVKPEVQRIGIAVVLHHGSPVAFGGDAKAPAVVITVTNATMPHEVTLPLTKGLTEISKRYYGSDPFRTYVFFQELKDLWLVGFDGVTFVELGAAAADARNAAAAQAAAPPPATPPAPPAKP